MIPVLNNIIHQFYFIMAGFFAIVMLIKVFKRQNRKTVIYDIVYVYTLIPFILRALHIK